MVLGRLPEQARSHPVVSHRTSVNQYCRTPTIMERVSLFIYLFILLLVTLVTDPSAPPGTVLILTLIARSLRLDHGTGEAT